MMGSPVWVALEGAGQQECGCRHLGVPTGGGQQAQPGIPHLEVATCVLVSCAVDGPYLMICVEFKVDEAVVYFYINSILLCSAHCEPGLKKRQNLSTNQNQNTFHFILRQIFYLELSYLMKCIYVKETQIEQFDLIYFHFCKKTNTDQSVYIESIFQNFSTIYFALIL